MLSYGIQLSRRNYRSVGVMLFVNIGKLCFCILIGPNLEVSLPSPTSTGDPDNHCDTNNLNTSEDSPFWLLMAKQVSLVRHMRFAHSIEGGARHP